MGKIKFYIDNHEVLADEGQSVLEAALEAGIFIPHLCHHKDLRDIGGCGLCVVEIGGETVRACLTKVEPDMKVISKSEKLEHIRTVAIQLMLAGHIDDCNSCPKYLKCEFQMLIQNQGATVGDLRGTARGLSANLENPLIIRDMERCIACGRCVRVCNEIRNVGALTYADDEKGRKYIATKAANLRSSDCRFCGACVEVCPTGALRDKEGVFAEDFCKGDMLVPCSYECPAHVDIPEYIRFIRKGENAHAFEKIIERAPFPNSLGNICMKFCENKCRRQYIDEPVAVCSLKRFAALNCDDGYKADINPKEFNGKRVAIIGAGPAGLTAAWLLRIKGYYVTVFEKMPEPGGMMRYGMPEYRLSAEDLSSDINNILSLGGIEVKYNVEVKDNSQLEGFDAAIWCGGAQKGVRLPLEGSEAEGIYTGLDYLKSVRIGIPLPVGKNVLVLGGGDVAFDCARTAVRMGSLAAVCCVEPEDRMTCSEHEKTDGLEEGVIIYAGKAFERILTTDGHVCGLECRSVKSFEFDKIGKLSVTTVETTQIIECDTVIFAVGQKVVIPDDIRIEKDEKDRATSTGLDSLKKFGITAAGDAVLGTSSAIQAIAEGQKAASDVDLFLGGDGDVIPQIAPVQVKNPDISGNDMFDEKRVAGYPESSEKRIKSFEPYVGPISGCDAVKQSARCLQCDLRKNISRPRLYSEYAFKREARNE